MPANALVPERQQERETQPRARSGHGGDRRHVAACARAVDRDRVRGMIRYVHVARAIDGDADARAGRATIASITF